MVAQNHSHATKDLYDTIASGSFPEWRLYIQTMNPADEDKWDFDPMDTTKIWPEELFPLQPVGRMVLNKNLDNFFNENEQLAFSPGVVPPGIYYSNDKMLQCRIFAYGDTQRHRLGPNYLLLPANAPKCAHHNNHHEGFMNFTHRDEEVSIMGQTFCAFAVITIPSFRLISNWCSPLAGQLLAFPLRLTSSVRALPYLQGTRQWHQREGEFSLPYYADLTSILIAKLYAHHLVLDGLQQLQCRRSISVGLDVLTSSNRCEPSVFTAK